MSKILWLLTLAVATLATTPLRAWPGGHHAQITSTAVQLLPAEDRQVVAAESAALARVYCQFPDENWAAYGEWGGGEADPRKPRFPDTRREWDISYYAGWNPVTREGQGWPHRPPESFAAVPHHFALAVTDLQTGRLEDGLRRLGVALHYIEDSGAFGHLQPIHRALAWRNLTDLRPDNYAPQRLGATPAQAAAGVRQRLEGLVRFTEQRADSLLQPAGLPIEEVKRLCAKELMPAAAVDAVTRLRTARADDWDAMSLACGRECAHVAADVLYTALQFVPRPLPQRAPPAAGVNLLFNPSFETPGDGPPQGWCVGWLNLNDHAGRAEWYRAGTHWDKPVHSGQYSLLMLWAPPEGIEWRPTWRRAVRVASGERYRGTAWVKTRSDAGAARIALEFSNAAYLPVQRVDAEKLSGDHDWRQLDVEGTAPAQSRWLRLILYSNSGGAVWFDDVSLVRLADR